MFLSNVFQHDADINAKLESQEIGVSKNSQCVWSRNQSWDGFQIWNLLKFDVDFIRKHLAVHDFQSHNISHVWDLFWSCLVNWLCKFQLCFYKIKSSFRNYETESEMIPGSLKSRLLIATFVHYQWVRNYDSAEMIPGSLKSSLLTATFVHSNLESEIMKLDQKWYPGA